MNKTSVKRRRSNQELETALATCEQLLMATAAFASLTWRDAKPDFEVTQTAYHEDDPTLTVRVFGADRPHGGVALLLSVEGHLLAGPSLLDDMAVGWAQSAHPNMRELARKCSLARGQWWSKD